MKNYNAFLIDRHTWRIEDCFRDYMYLVEGTEKAVLIDTGMGLPGLDEFVRGLTDRPVTVINTHGHLDHVGGNCQFSERYMMAEDEEILREHTDYDFRRKLMKGFAQEFDMRLAEGTLEKWALAGRFVPYRPLTDGQIFDLGDRRLQVIAAPGHTIGSVCILDCGKKMLFCADTVCDIGILLFFSHSAPVEAFRDSILRLKEYAKKFEVMWPGHHKCPLDLHYLDEYAECAEQILVSPERGEPVRSNLGEGKIVCNGRISITY